MLACVVGWVVLGQWLPWTRWVESAVGQGGDAPASWIWLYPLVFCLCNLLLLPGGILAAASGWVFGGWQGGALTVMGSMLAAAVAAPMGRLLGGEWLQARFGRNAWWLLLEKRGEQEGVWLVCFTQMHPLSPSSLLNYLYGATRLRFSACVLGVGMGQAPSLFLYAFLGRMTWLTRLGDTGGWAGWALGSVMALVATVGLWRISARWRAEIAGLLSGCRDADSAVEPGDDSANRRALGGGGEGSE